MAPYGRAASSRHVSLRLCYIPATMSALPSPRGLSVPDMEVILAVTSKLAAPFDLMTMLSEVVNAAKQVLHADRGSVWLYEAPTDELVLEIATGIEPVRSVFSAEA